LVEAKKKREQTGGREGRRKISGNNFRQGGKCKFIFTAR